MQKILVVAPRNALGTHAIDKLRRLAALPDTQLQLLVPTHSSAMDRHYFFGSEFFSGERWHKLLAEQQREIDTELATVLQTLREAGADSSGELIAARDWLAPVERALEPSVNLLVLLCPPGRLPGQYWYLVHRAPMPVLLLRPQAWSSPLRTLGAIDPTHQHDRPLQSDLAIIASIKVLAATLGDREQWSLLHACYVAAIALDYQAQIQELHRAALAELATTAAVSSRRLQMLEGSPETVLPAAVSKQHIDVLVMGVSARGVAERWMTGSTLEHAAEQLTCDLCLIKPNPPLSLHR